MTLFFTDTESFFVVLVLICVKTTVSVTLDDDDDEVDNRLSWELFVQEENDDEVLLLSFFLEVKQEPPHSCTLTTKLDLEPAVT